jgi:peptidyl-dipeptidase Dcp
MLSTGDPAADLLLKPWDGPVGGLPPFDRATASAIATAYRAAMAAKLAEISAIAADPAPPSFANVIEALEDSGRPLARVEALWRSLAQQKSDDAMCAVDAELAPLPAQLDGALAREDRLFARVSAVCTDPSLSPEQARLADHWRRKLVRMGSGLDAAGRNRLAAINGRLGELSSAFQRNLAFDNEALTFAAADQGAGVPDTLLEQARTAAESAGRPAELAFLNSRAVVMTLLAHAQDRRLRESVFRRWQQRNRTPGPHDNRALLAEMATLRGEKARLLGFESFAHFALDNRMARTPQAAVAMAEAMWRRIQPVTATLLADLQALADRDGIVLKAWDRLFYAEQRRRSGFDLDQEAVRPYLPLTAVRDAIMEAASRLHGLQFEPLPDAPRLSPEIEVFAVRRGDKMLGALWLDSTSRSGKAQGSYMQPLRLREQFRGEVPAIVLVVSSPPAAAPGEPILLTWEYARVLFHEFGHALHMLLSEAAWPSLASLNVAWDFIEVPSLLNERWLEDRDLLARHARHWQTGEPIPDALVDRLLAVANDERVFTTTLDYLAMALFDLKLHMAADGTPVDPEAIETAILAHYGLPDAIEPIMRGPNMYHISTDHYAAGVYSYLWADVMAADAAEAFLQGEGLFDPSVAARLGSILLGGANSRPADLLYQDFRGRPADGDALLRRFGLLEPAQM